MVDMCRLWGARQGFSHVTLSLSLKWEITLRNWLTDALWGSLSCVHTKETTQSHHQLLSTVTSIECIYHNTYCVTCSKIDSSDSFNVCIYTASTKWGKINLTMCFFDHIIWIYLRFFTRWIRSKWKFISTIHICLQHRGNDRRLWKCYLRRKSVLT